MKILRVIDRNSVLSQFNQDHDRDFISYAIGINRYCFWISMNQIEFRNLLINSSPNNPHPLLAEFPTIEDVVIQIQQNPVFLTQNPQERILNGSRIGYYVDLLNRGSALQECFIRDKDVYMPSRGKYYVADGMHRLVAYAVWTNLNTNSFPISVYLCTNTPIESLEVS
jgi:hypothetical protein